jgi:hypothetical protein
MQGDDQSYRVTSSIAPSSIAQYQGWPPSEKNAEIHIPNTNGLEISCERVTLDLTTSLFYGMTRTRSPFPSFNPIPWPQADM